MITLIYAGLCGLMAVFLANQVLYVRLRAAQQPDWRSNAVERAQGNFVENVPLALVLIGLLEYSGVEPLWLHIFGALLVLLRVLHAYGMSNYPGANYPRLIGAQGTFLLLSTLSIAALMVAFN